MTTKTSAPSHAPSRRYRPPMTAITSTSMVAARPMVDGAICAFHQTKRIPPIAAMRPANANASVRCQRDAVAERAHAHRVVADALQRQPERRAHDVAQGRVDEQRDRERHEVQPLGVRRAAQEVGDRDAADAAEAGDARHLAEDQVRDHREDQRDHQEVDPVAAARQRAEDEGDSDRDDDRDGDARHLGPAEVQALRVAVRGQVAEREAGDAVDRRSARARPCRRRPTGRSGSRRRCRGRASASAAPRPSTR